MTSSGTSKSPRTSGPASFKDLLTRRAWNSRKARLASFEAFHLVRILGAVRQASPGDPGAGQQELHLAQGNPRHPSLQLKRIEELWSVRVGQHYRAIGIDAPSGIQWIWIVSHANYDRFIA